MQAGAVSVLCLAFALTAIGCVDRDPYSANDVAAADAFHARQSAIALRNAPESGGATAAGKVRCRCDAEGGLHVEAPQGSKVVPMRADTSEDAEAEITLAERRAGRPIRQTVSLGFIGDNKLNETPSRNHGDALLPPHAHGVPDRPYAYGTSYGYGGPRAYGYGAVSRGHGGQVPQQYVSRGGPPLGGHNVNGSPHIRTTGWGGSSSGSSGGSTGTHASSGRGPR
jgi:hypothetical protein